MDKLSGHVATCERYWFGEGGRLIRCAEMERLQWEFRAAMAAQTAAIRDPATHVAYLNEWREGYLLRRAGR
jgi:hypothetical protein